MRFALLPTKADKGDKVCGGNSKDSMTDFAIRTDESGDIYLTPQNGSSAAIDSHADWTERMCKDVRYSAERIRIDQFDLDHRVCLKTNGRRYAEVFGFIRVGPASIRMTFVSW